MTTKSTNTDPFTLPLMNDYNITAFREAHGVETQDDLHKAMHTSALLKDAYNALLEPLFGESDFRDTLDGMEEAIDILDAVITPTEEALSDYFIDEWVLEVVDGECHVRYQPLQEDERFSA